MLYELVVKISLNVIDASLCQVCNEKLVLIMHA